MKKRKDEKAADNEQQADKPRREKKGERAKS
jgi:hypothetical protein